MGCPDVVDVCAGLYREAMRFVETAGFRIVGLCGDLHLKF